MSALHSPDPEPLEQEFAEYQPLPSQIVNLEPRPPHLCRWCRAAELQPGAERDFRTVTDQWQTPNLCKPCALILGEYLHSNLHSIAAGMRGFASGLAAARLF